MLVLQDFSTLDITNLCSSNPCTNTLANLISLTLKIYPWYGYAHHVHYHRSGLCHFHCLPDYSFSVGPAPSAPSLAQKGPAWFLGRQRLSNPLPTGEAGSFGEYGEENKENKSWTLCILPSFFFRRELESPAKSWWACLCQAAGQSPVNRHRSDMGPFHSNTTQWHSACP